MIQIFIGNTLVVKDNINLNFQQINNNNINNINNYNNYNNNNYNINNIGPVQYYNNNNNNINNNFNNFKNNSNNSNNNNNIRKSYVSDDKYLNNILPKINAVPKMKLNINDNNNKIMNNNIENKIKFYEEKRITLNNQLNNYFNINNSENYKFNIENIENQIKENENENKIQLNKEKENFENLIISLQDIDPTIQKEIVQINALNDDNNNNKNKEKIFNFIKTHKEKFIDKLN